MWKHVMGGVVLITLNAAVVAAQTPTQAAPEPPPPAAAKLNPSLVTPYHHTFRMVMTRNGQEQEVGSLDDAVVRATDQGTPAIIRIQKVQSPGGVMQDSAVADAATLAPRRHNSHAERRHISLEFSRQHVTGTLSATGEPPTPIDEKVADEVYDSNMLDVLIAAMPLAEGYSGRLMVYLYEAGGAIPLEVSVTGSEKVKEAETWVANVALNKRSVRYYVTKADHRVVQIVSTLAPGTELRLVR